MVLKVLFGGEPLVTGAAYELLLAEVDGFHVSAEIG